MIPSKDSGEGGRLFVAVIASVCVVIGYEMIMAQLYPAPPPGAAPVPTATAPEAARPPSVPADFAAPIPGPPARIDGAAPEVASSSPTAAPLAAPSSELAGRPVRVRTDTFDFEFTTAGGRIRHARLNHHRKSLATGSPLLDLVAPSRSGLPLDVVLRGKDEAWSDAAVVYEASVEDLLVSGEESASLELRGALPDGGTITKRFVFRGSGHTFDVAVDVDSKVDRWQEWSLGWSRSRPQPGDSMAFEGAEALIGRSLEQFELDDLSDGIIVPGPFATGEIRWAGFADTYFLAALIPQAPEAARLWAKGTEAGVVTQILLPMGAERTGAADFVAYVGPKDLENLQRAGGGLSRALDLGFLSMISEPLLWALKAFHGMTGNYGLDIILLTILIKVLFLPLTHKSYQSMQAMQKLQPEMKRLQEKYADDRQKMNEEVMELYKRHQVNPLGGCLPMLLQMPVFIGLYQALMYAVELRHTPFAWWINDLSAPDRLPAFPADPLGMAFGYEVRIPVLTLLMGASMFVQQRMTPMAGDPMQQRIMMMMPIFFTAMFINFPSGLVLYWFVNNVLTIAQQAYIQKQSQPKKAPALA